MMISTVRHPFEPVYDAASHILILGTMPSPASRKYRFYYTHPRNRFWPLLADIFGEPFPPDHQRKEQLVLRHHLALWDVLASCEIQGAADRSIRKPQPNNIADLVRKTNIGTILCNGTAAANLYRRFCAPLTGISGIALPSTSPANQRITFPALAAVWRTALAPARP